MFNYISNYIFWTKVLNRISFEKNRMWRYLPTKHIVNRSIGHVPNKQILKQKLQQILGVFDENLINHIDAITISRVKEKADQVLAHNFELLGSGMVILDPINWHKDFKSGFVWTKGKFYLNYRKSDVSINSDVKVPWELSRCHHLLWLGEMYLITNEEKYAKEIIFQVEDWINENPLMYSINWTCAMDVAIRAVNWMFALNMIISSHNVTDKFINKIYLSLYQHGFYIFNNLEKNIPYSNNHYASNLAGLLYLGYLFKDTKKGKAWWNFSINEFYMEVRTQILPSGVHYEKTISYHRLMTEIFSYPMYMLLRVKENVPIDIMYRVQLMYNYIAEYIKPNGKAPMIGDNDDGRFLPFLFNDFMKHGYLIDSESIDNIIVSCGIGYLFEVNKSHLSNPVNNNYTDFKILRKKDAYLFFNNGGYSKFNYAKKKLIGTHTHNDLLSFDFSLGEDDVIVDPGTYIYSSSIKSRNEFRSTRKHNTIVVDDEEQNVLFDRNLFFVEANVNIGKINCSETENIIQCNGSYSTLKGEMRHKRYIVLSECNLLITDEIYKVGKNHIASISFHFACEVELNISEGNLLIDTKHFQILMSFENIKVVEENIIHDTISPSYGIIHASKTLVINYPFDNEIKIRTNIKWIRKNNIKLR